MPFQVVIDTSVMVAAACSRSGASFELLRLFHAGDTRWEWNISTALLVEYEAALKREQHRQGRDPSEVDRLLDDVAARANRHAIFYLIRPYLTDPDDEVRPTEQQREDTLGSTGNAVEPEPACLNHEHFQTRPSCAMPP